MIDFEKEIERLSEVCSVSPREDMAHPYFTALCSQVFDDISVDFSGSITARKSCGKKGAKKLLIDAHIDEIGFMVSEICDGGFVKLKAIGGIANAILPASVLIIHGREDIPCIISAKPPHLQTEDDRKKLTELSDMYADTGYCRNTLEKLIRIGDIAGFLGGSRKMLGDRINSKGMDDRLCALCVIEAVSLAAEKLSYDVSAIFSSQEETTSLGARTATAAEKPDLAIAVDVTHAEHDGEKSTNPFRFTEGCTVSISDTISLDMADYLLALADKQAIPCHPSAEPSYTGTNAHYIETALSGVPTALISLPIRYMHTPVETVSISDCKTTARLIAAFLEDGGFSREEVEIIG